MSNYQDITDSIIKSIESGDFIKWTRGYNPSLCESPFAPRSLHSKKPYTGINRILLGLKNQESNFWVTYKQCESLGGCVKKGEKGTKICYFQPYEVKDKNDPEKITTIPMLKIYTVFSIWQTEGLKAPKEEDLPKGYEWDSLEDLEALVPCPIIHDNPQTPCYSPTRDVIRMPDKQAWEKRDSYYATLMHEAAHSTLHSSRCNRDFGKRFGDEAYAFEELIAELGSAFLISDLKLSGKRAHEDYISSWLTVLKKDSKAIFKAASEAEKAVKWLYENSKSKIRVVA